ncbi:MAG TPA: glycoside hydrolase family 6 protein [Solirubrobacteraceae bacterium]|nr:glycoside hydrolase family 6 protein [Solirubrobacteraceae bacterium]
MTRVRALIPTTTLALGAVALLAAIAAAGAAGAGPAGAARTAGAGTGAQAHAAAACPSGLGSARDPSNPLALATPPGSNPLSGAQSRLFVQTPARGTAGKAIASLLGVTPPDSESWASFTASLQSGALAGKLSGNPTLAGEVSLLSKIADEPETSRFSGYTAGGGPGAISSQLNKFLCRMHTVDPGAIPLLSTYFILHNNHCATESASEQAVFKRQVDEFVAGVANYPTVVFIEEDAVDTSGCLTRAGFAIRKQLLAYEVSAVAKIPHAVAYLDGGTEDANSAKFAATILNAAGIGKIRGFFLNATHKNWTSKEIAFGTKISKLTGGAHFIVNTADNGRGPLLNRHPSTQGVENLCNPPGRGLGPKPTTATGFPLVDAFEWTSVPGKSGGVCHPGDPPGGVFGVNLALTLARNATNQLGPGYPSQPY